MGPQDRGTKSSKPIYTSIRRWIYIFKNNTDSIDNNDKIKNKTDQYFNVINTYFYNFYNFYKFILFNINNNEFVGHIDFLSNIINLNFNEIDNNKYNSFIEYMKTQINKLFKNINNIPDKYNSFINNMKNLLSTFNNIDSNNSTDKITIYKNVNTILTKTTDLKFDTYDDPIILDRFQIFFQTNEGLYNKIKDLDNLMIDIPGMEDKNKMKTTNIFNLFKYNKIKTINNCKDEFIIYINFEKKIFIKYNDYYQSILDFYARINIFKQYNTKFGGEQVLNLSNYLYDFINEYYYYPLENYKIADGSIPIEFKNIKTYDIPIEFKDFDQNDHSFIFMTIIV